VEIQLHLFLTSVLRGGEWPASCPDHFTHGEKNTWYQLNRRMGGPHSQDKHSGEKEIPARAGNRAPDCPNHSSPTLHIILPQLLEHETTPK